MSVRANATAVGAFVLGAVAIAIAVVVVFGSGLLFKDVSHYVIYFQGSLEGLSVGAPVKYRGVQVGQVVSIAPSFEPEQRAVQIPVVIELTRDAVEGYDDGDHLVATMVKEGLRARLELASLITGQLFVGLDLFPGTPIRDEPDATGYVQIPSVPSLQYGLQQTLNDLLSDRPRLEQGLNQTLELLNVMVADGGAEHIATTIRAVAGLSERLADPNGPLLRALGELPPLLEDVGRTAAALPPMMDQAGQVMGSVNGLVSGPEAPVTRTIVDLQAALVNLGRLSDQLTTTVVQLRGPVVGFAQTGLPSLQGLIEDLDRAVGEVSRTVRDLRQDPTRFLLGDSAAQGVRLQ